MELSNDIEARYDLGRLYQDKRYRGVHDDDKEELLRGVIQQEDDLFLKYLACIQLAEMLMDYKEEEAMDFLHQAANQNQCALPKFKALCILGTFYLEKSEKNPSDEPSWVPRIHHEINKDETRGMDYFHQIKDHKFIDYWGHYRFKFPAKKTISDSIFGAREVRDCSGLFNSEAIKQLEKLDQEAAKRQSKAYKASRGIISKVPYLGNKYASYCYRQGEGTFEERDAYEQAYRRATIEHLKARSVFYRLNGLPDLKNLFEIWLLMERADLAISLEDSFSMMRFHGSMDYLFPGRERERYYGKKALIENLVFQGISLEFNPKDDICDKFNKVRGQLDQEQLFMAYLALFRLGGYYDDNNKEQRLVQFTKIMTDKKQKTIRRNGTSCKAFDVENRPQFAKDAAECFDAIMSSPKPAQ